jgi:DnaK suppressor protein
MLNRHPLIEEARRTLLSRRQTLLRLSAGHVAAGSVLLSEREADWEDLAAEIRDAAVLDRLASGERGELVEIDAALDRLQAGSWGLCVACGETIGAARLRARPESAVCLGCAERREPRRIPA